MKFYYLLFGIFFLAVTSCQNEIDYEVNEKEILHITAGVETGSSTRSTLDKIEIGYTSKNIWVEGDELRIFFGEENNRASTFNLIKGSGTTIGTFSGISYITGGGESNENEYSFTNVAYHPANYISKVKLNKESKEYTAYITLPDSYDGTPGTYTNGTYPMISVAKVPNTTSFAFKNILGMLALKIRGDRELRSIQIISKDNALAGDFTVLSSHNDNPILEHNATGDLYKTLTVECNNFQLVEDGTIYAIPVPPMTYASGDLTIVIRTKNLANGKNLIKRLSINQEITINRSAIYLIDNIPSFMNQ